MTRLYVDAWDPAYAAAVEPGEGGGPVEASSAQLDTGVETPAEVWRPLSPPADVRAPDVVLLVDGVRRNDARLWTEEDDGTSYPGLAASYAAGVVRCDLRRGVAELVGSQVERGLFTASPTAAEVRSGQVRYTVHRVSRGELPDLQQAVQGPMTILEVNVAAAARQSTGAAGGVLTSAKTRLQLRSPEDGAELLVVDGPLRQRQHLTHTIGYIKTHHKQYLPAQLVSVVTSLAPGQRSPVFRLGTNWHRYTWYLRLPGPWGGTAPATSSHRHPAGTAGTTTGTAGTSGTTTGATGTAGEPAGTAAPVGAGGRRGAPWAGIVRAECAAELPISEAVALADLSTVTLPRFAATAYKDPRAPQNLIPIAGLERRLRSLLGDARLLHRALTSAAART